MTASGGKFTSHPTKSHFAAEYSDKTSTVTTMHPRSYKGKASDEYIRGSTVTKLVDIHAIHAILSIKEG
jgi:hypothetical protein